jgi:hypothetical protein
MRDTADAEWADFAPFQEWAAAAGYASGLSLDRRDNDLGYSPSNCRWITMKEQQRNKSDTVLVTAWGETKCVAAWVEDARCQCGYIALAGRIKKGMDPETAIVTPPWQHPDSPNRRFKGIDPP